MNLEQEIRDAIERNKAIREEVGQMNCTLSKLENKCEQYTKDADEIYQCGLNDAMNAFKKLYSCGWERDWKAMGFEFDEGEWSSSFEYIIGQYTASEIVEKVKAYEKSSKHFGVGDFVSYDDLPEIIVLVTYVGRDTFNGIAVADVEGHCRIGEVYSYCAFKNWHKVNAQIVKGAES